ncbi:VOC family protein [Mucilaginibacter sp. R-33]|uniref:VOC family protein n=1 Tax=Mucilaginibacter sp. R-33 TaxID=3416711 RepID=UPI003CEC3391
MKQFITHITLVVNDYDEAIQFYVEKLNFDLVEDTPINENKRWVLVRPRGAFECSLLLAKAVGDEQEGRIGQQTGGRVFLFLRTDDFWRDYRAMQDKNIIFVREPQVESYGTVAVFKDPFGNLWDLLG